nr:cell adhesion molecule 3-like [Anolis sagrei ordinatus]
MEVSVPLNVRYPPQMVQTAAEIREENKSFTLIYDIAEIVVKKGNLVTLHCFGDGNPLPSMIWLKKSQSLGRLHFITDRELKIANVQIPDVGTYTCKVNNSEGVAYTDFQLAIQESGDLSSFVPLLLVLCLNKVLLCFFFFFAMISFSTQRKAQVRRGVTKDIKKIQPAMAPEEKEMDRKEQKRNEQK